MRAMFWALNGATRSPRRASRRQKAAASRLFPALEQVPCTMSAGGRDEERGEGYFMAKKEAVRRKRGTCKFSGAWLS